MQLASSVYVYLKWDKQKLKHGILKSRRAVVAEVFVILTLHWYFKTRGDKAPVSFLNEPGENEADRKRIDVRRREFE